MAGMEQGRGRFVRAEQPPIPHVEVPLSEVTKEFEHLVGSQNPPIEPVVPNAEHGAFLDAHGAGMLCRGILRKDRPILTAGIKEAIAGNFDTILFESTCTEPDAAGETTRAISVKYTSSSDEYRSQSSHALRAPGHPLLADVLHERMREMIHEVVDAENGGTSGILGLDDAKCRVTLQYSRPNYLQFQVEPL